MTLRAGTLITVRLEQGLSSDRNQGGDAFSATLVKPVMVDGVVVAERGQTASGSVVEAKKASLGEGVSRLKIQLTDLALSDGQPVPIKTLLISQRGPTSPAGQQAAIIGGTTVTGAAIGAAAGWGTGAAIGAGAGAMAGIIGVLLTRNHPTILYPESVLTFQIDAPVTISTDQAPQAFRWSGPNDYEQPYPMQAQMQPPPAAGPCGPYGCPPPAPYSYGYYGSGSYYSRTTGDRLLASSGDRAFTSEAASTADLAASAADLAASAADWADLAAVADLAAAVWRIQRRPPLIGFSWRAGESGALLGSPLRGVDFPCTEAQQYG